MTPTFGVVGLGRMAQALLFPLLEAGLVQREGVRAVVASEASAACLAQAHGLAMATDAAAAWTAPVVLLAVCLFTLPPKVEFGIPPPPSNGRVALKSNPWVWPHRVQGIVFSETFLFRL